MTLARDPSTAAQAPQAVVLQGGEDMVFPPGDIYSDEPPLETDLHRDQIDLLIRLLRWLWQDRQDFYVSGNITIYYSPNQLKSEDFRGPDFFVVLGTERRSRKSWVVWEEGGKYPNIIIELLSESTAQTDRGLKKQLYQDTFRTPDYFWFDPNTLEFQGYHLLDGKYHELEPNERGWLWSHQLELYLGIQDQQLRFFTPGGQLVPTPEETAQAEHQRNDKLAAKLRELGVDPDDL
ncbi:Uma2 family endonuclease [Nodosilinea sp. LEGE 07088]|uniref:Uma2 family endonuclease n=1 Tax=Nodosilinea sp. LEGE 07088 TaxID=2777968 RepID=UPI0018810C5A|nr:Uma2 family endonuclease [Nodosilinea sp. LEGE 07088]MBE9141177.1 Uma2 family endonuclease [Nodosilinea sp. LEGE 07088]